MRSPARTARGGGGASRGIRALSVVTVVATYLLVVMGGVVRVTGSGLGCGSGAAGSGNDWPLCHGRLVPPADAATVIEFTHRSLALIATVLVVSLVLVTWARYRHLPRVVAGATVAVGLLILQILLGAVTVELRLPGLIVLAHLANAEVLLGVLIYVALSLNRPAGGPAAAAPAAAAVRTAGRLAAVAAGTAFVLLLSGALVVAENAGTACAGWPLCGGGFQVTGQGLAALNLLHRYVAGAALLVIGFATWRLVRAHPGDRAVRAAAVAVAVLLAAQVAVGAIAVELTLPTPLRGLHLALASAVWATVALLAMLVRPAGAATAPAALPQRERARHAGTAVS